MFYFNLLGKIVITLMDRGQTAPVVVNGGRRQVVLATIFSHPLWRKFNKKTLNSNLRVSLNNPEYRHIQELFAKVLKQIRTNGVFDPTENDCPITELFHDKELGNKNLHLIFKQSLILLINF